MTEKIIRFNGLLSQASTITVVTHTHPDGDAMGSATAMAAYLADCRQKDVLAIIPDPWPSKLQFLAEGMPVICYAGNEEAAESRLAKSDLIICTDFNAINRAGALESGLAASAAAKVLIDHHLNPAESDFTICFSHTAISSASELMYNILMEMPDIAQNAAKLPHRAAEALMAGMTTDTNNFANSVYPSTLRMASALLEAGVDRDALLQKIFNMERENRIRAMGVILKDKLTICPNGLAYYIVDEATWDELKLQDGELEGIVNIPLNIAGVRLSISAKEDGNQFRISVRSKKGISANSLAKKFFNGGGHEQAAGGKVMMPENIGKPAELADYIEDSVARFLQDEGSENN